jgi:hypothetical protein
MLTRFYGTERKKRDYRTRIHGNARMRGVRASTLHAHHESQAASEKSTSKPWTPDSEATTRLREYYQHHESREE